MKTSILSNKKWFFGLVILLLAGVGLLGWGIQQALALRAAVPAVMPSPIHPVFAMLDENGENVLSTGKPVSTMRTCGECHDTAFIVSHSFHADLGLRSYQTSANGWNASDGVFGKWDPLAYRYLSQTGDKYLDLGTPEWLMKFGERIPGGGPATTARAGGELTNLVPDATNPETAILDPQSGQAIAWDWKQSGSMEMDCFLCHMTQPNSAARAEEIRAGHFGQANTATLVGSGLLDKNAQGYSWNKAAFDESGKLKGEFMFIQDPTNANCAACHGEVHANGQDPLVISACDQAYPQTATTGQVIASQKISESGVNLSGKEGLARAWDIHAERGLNCTDCHFSLNNPVHSQKDASTVPAHLKYDPRKLEIGEYLQRPDHDFARGQSAQFNVAPENKGTMRRCESCHDSQVSHADWLPYPDQHMAVVACESCHIPQLYAPAIQSYDWTVVQADGTPTNLCRGIQGGSNTVTNLVTGFKPVLMQRTNSDGKTMLTPYNLITSWFWVYDDANGPRPVREADIKAAYLDKGVYAPEIMAAFDKNGNGSIDSAELKISTEEQKSVVAARLVKLGLNNPRIEGQVQPYSVNHNVTSGEYATRECSACHNDNSRVTQPMQLAAYAPAGVMPSFVSDTNVNVSGEIVKADGGALYYEPVTTRDGVYVFGHDRVNLIDWFGALAFAGTILAVGGHGTLRYISGLKRQKSTPKTQKVFMYEEYERFWHWLQTVSIILLLFTGLIIHRPDIFGAFSFPHMVLVHNVLAAILVVNALLSLFWHLTTGEIRQYIPRPAGFFDDAIVQARFYINGIFKGDPHPFEKVKNRKLNPLQQATYFGLLNVLLPLQVITGALMWSVQKWPELTTWMGGLPVLAPFHSLVAWMLAAFVVAHVYLTTTGATPLEAMRGMVTGWEDIEVHGHSASQPGKPKGKK